jgi:hypothetical protein
MAGIQSDNSQGGQLKYEIDHYAFFIQIAIFTYVQGRLIKRLISYYYDGIINAYAW